MIIFVIEPQIGNRNHIRDEQLCNIHNHNHIRSNKTLSIHIRNHNRYPIIDPNPDKNIFLLSRLM